MENITPSKNLYLIVFGNMGNMLNMFGQALQFAPNAKIFACGVSPTQKEIKEICKKLVINMKMSIAFEHHVDIALDEMKALERLLYPCGSVAPFVAPFLAYEGLQFYATTLFPPKDTMIYVMQGMNDEYKLRMLDSKVKILEAKSKNDIFLKQEVKNLKNNNSALTLQIKNLEKENTILTQKVKMLEFEKELLTLGKNSSHRGWINV